MTRLAVSLNEVRSVILHRMDIAALECAMKSADKWNGVELNKQCLIFEWALTKQAKTDQV